jgi:YfiH family protein
MNVEQTPLGRIVIPGYLPPGFALFYTTADFDGRLTAESTAGLLAIARDRFGIDATLTTCTQVHGATVTRAQGASTWRECDSCDALWSDERHSALGIKVADCLPITMLDPTHSIIANIHSGWRGSVQRITNATLSTLERETAFEPGTSHAYLGPSIRACCFEVGEEVVDQFAASYGDLTPYIRRDGANPHLARQGARPHIDQPAIVTDVLRAAGFADERIHDSGLCTRCDGSIFHSYRRAGKGGGRNLAVVAQ